MRIVFFGTPSFAIPSLNALIQSGHHLVAAVTRTDKRKGRNTLPAPSPVKEFAVSRGIRLFQPSSLKDSIFKGELSLLSPDAIVVVAYGKILPVEILGLPAYGCINVHASLLPAYRGAAPVQWALINGEERTGVTTMLMNEGLDTGDILMQEEAVIDKDDTVETLGRRLSETGASLLIKTLEARERGTVRPFPQSGIPSYAPPLKKEHGRIDWTKTSREISSLVRGVYPWPGAYCYLNGERIKIIRAEFVEGHGIPSRIEKAREGEFLVGTGNGLLSIVTVQPEGKKPMSSGSFLLGRKIMEGTSFDGI